MSTTLVDYLEKVQRSLVDQDGPTGGQLLSIRKCAGNPRLYVENPEMAVSRIVEPPYDEIYAAHLRCMWACNIEDYIEAYRCQAILVQAMIKALQAAKEENWQIPIMFSAALDLRLVAIAADKSATASAAGKPCETLEKAAELLMGLFRICVSDTRTAPEDSKRWGILYLVNQLFKIYFKINKLHLCKPLIRAIDSSNIKDQFLKAQLVTYRYYVGRKAMFDSDFKLAEQYLTFAFEKCHRSSTKNKRLILIYLIPVKMLLGKMPKIELLDKYDMPQFKDIVQAVKCGDVLRLNKALVDHEAFFIQTGIFLILEKLKLIAYRNLFKTVYLLMKNHQIPIEAFLVPLRAVGIDDAQEVQCILSNLIYEGKIKGYISFQHQKLVVSKQNAFPPLASIS